MNSSMTNSQKQIHPEIQDDSLAATFSVAVHARDGTVFEFTARYDLPFGRSEPHLTSTDEYFSELVEKNVAHTAMIQMRVYLRALAEKYAEERRRAEADKSAHAPTGAAAHLNPAITGNGISLPPRPMANPKTPTPPQIHPFPFPVPEALNSKPELTRVLKSKAA